MSGPGVAQVVGAEFPNAQNIAPQDFDPPTYRPHRHHLIGELLIFAATTQEGASRPQIRLIRSFGLHNIPRQFHPVNRVRLLPIDNGIARFGKIFYLQAGHFTGPDAQIQ